MYTIKQGFRGLAIPVWEIDSGRVGFLPAPITPNEWMKFIEGHPWSYIERKVNGTLKIIDG
jgi:hypothetical protein